MLLRCLILGMILIAPARAMRAQTAEFSQPEMLFKSEHWEVVNPKWAPDGEHIAFSTPQYRGLYVLSRATGFQKMRRLTDEAAAGYAYRWSPDGRYIVARIARFDQAHRLDALHWFGVKDNKSKDLTGFVKDAPGLPQWMRGVDTIGYFKAERIHRLSTLINDTTESIQGASRKVFIADHMLIITDAGGAILHQINPVPGNRYHKAVLSPNDEKIAFQAAGKIYLTSSDGTGLQEIGRGNSPVWSSDGTYLAYELSKDDGHQYIASDIYAYNLQNNKSINLTSGFGQLAVQPDWAPDGSSLIFTTLDEGAIYSIDIEY